MLRTTLLAASAAGALASAASAQISIPNEFDSAGNALAPLYSYFGGVAAFGAETSPTIIHSGPSLRCWANFRRDNFFRVAGFAIGSLGINRSGGALLFPPAADTFSITVQSPPAPYISGQLRLIVALREDDNGDGVIDTVESDDQWETEIPISAGTAIYNVPLAQFEDADPAAGNGVRNFATTGMMAMLLTFETRTIYPGGMIETPQSLLIDHVGLYAGPQSIPGPRCPADINGIGGVTVQDLFDFLTLYFSLDPRADLNGLDGVTFSDLFDYLVRYFTPCP